MESFTRGEIPILIETLSQDFKKARSVNQTSATFVSKVPTLAEPFGDAGTATGASVFDMSFRPAGQLSQNVIVIVPYGTGADDTTFSLRLIGWRRVPPAGSSTSAVLWVPVNLIELQCTLSAVVGIAGATVVNTERFADIITVTTGSTLGGEAPAENIVSPANDTIANAMVDFKGFQKIELSFTTGSSATDCNALVALL